jgi:hypothetical protein
VKLREKALVFLADDLPEISIQCISQKAASKKIIDEEFLKIKDKLELIEMERCSTVCYGSRKTEVEVWGGSGCGGREAFKPGLGL